MTQYCESGKTFFCAFFLNMVVFLCVEYSVSESVSYSEAMEIWKSP